MINRPITPLLLAACAFAFAANRADAQASRGFDQVLPAAASGIELNQQRDLWVMEVQFKPMRIVWVDFTDPATGTTTREPVWYLAYRCLPRPLPTIDDTATSPQNDLDPLLGKSRFIPEFTLITYEDRGTEIPDQILMDQIIPEALPVINQIERPRNVDTYPQFLDSVSLVQDAPDPVAADAESQPWIYGVATWRGVSPETDFLKIVVLGFSNGFETNADGNLLPNRKGIQQRFTRLGDEFDQTLQEFAFDGQPEWLYIPDQGVPAAQ